MVRNAVAGIFGALAVLTSIATAQPVTTPEDDENSFTAMRRIEANAIAASQGRVERDGPSLSVRAEQRTVVFRDVDDRDAVGDVTECERSPERCPVFIFRPYGQGHRGFIVTVAYSEGRETLWIDDVTGAETEIGGEPHFSPDGTRFVVVEAWICCNSFDGVRVWSSVGPRPEWEHAGSFENNRAYFKFRRWLDNDRVELGAEVEIPSTNLPGYTSQTFLAILSRKRGAWTIERQTDP